jgi:hypothetical protein
MNQYDFDTNNKEFSQKAFFWTAIAFIIFILSVFLASCSHRTAAPVHPTELDIYADKTPQK